MAFTVPPPLSKQVITGITAAFMLFGTTDSSGETPETDSSQQRSDLETIHVRAQSETTGTTTLDQNRLRALPNHTGSVTGALTSVPEIQFSNTERSSLTGGEIRPPRISISGAKPYENSFLVDGIGNSNVLNPSGLGAEDNNAGASFNDLTVHGADQNLFYDIGLVESVTVYSSNIPARYSGFTGGVVEAELRDPRSDKWGVTLSGKYTKDAWYDMRDVDAESESPDNQPEFSIYSINAVAEGPLSENTSLMTGFSRRHSDIPLIRRERIASREYASYDDTQFRTNENYFAKLVTTPTENVNLTFDLTYAPYHELRWREAWADSDWEIYNDAFRLSAHADILTSAGIVSAKTAYSQNGYSRDTATSYRYSRSDYSGSDEGEQYGGVGDATTENQSIDLKLHFESNELKHPVLKRVATGLDINSTTTDMWNEAATSEVIVETGTRITHTVTEYEEHDQSKSLKTLGFYAEGDMVWGRLVFSPGFRADYDSFTENLDIAPRLKAEFDTFDNGTLRLVAGYNRYYGTSLRAYAFDRFRPYINNQWRTDKPDGTPQHVIIDKTGPDKSYMARGLDTPYSDEIMGGIFGQAGPVGYSIEAVHRDHRKQLLSRSEKIGSDYNYWMTNDGEGSFDGISASLSWNFDTGSWGNHTFRLGAAKSWIETFNGGYDDNAYTTSYGIERDYFMVFYNGELMPRSEMPADNFNSPLVLTLTWQANFMNDKLRFYSVNRWRDDAEGLKMDQKVNSDTPYGTTSGSETRESSAWMSESGAYYHDAYAYGKIKGGIMSDLSMELDVVSSPSLTTTVLFDVTNVFNSRPGTSATEGGSARGRGFYLGMRLGF
jgi:hypothetical protein